MRKIAVVLLLLAPVMAQAAEIEVGPKSTPEIDRVVEQPAAGEFPSVVLPETTTRVRLSSSDLNRISCQSDIREVLTSSEKGLTIKITGKDAFVKFKVARKGDHLTYAATPTELYIVCGDETFSMIAFPQRIPSQTLRLATGRSSRIKANRSLYAGLPFEKKVLKALKELYTENLPDSYSVNRTEQRFTSFREILLTLKRTVEIEGEGLRIKEYEATLRDGTSLFKMNEKMFLRTELTENPVAIALEHHLLRPGDTSRLFIVEQRAEKPGPRKLTGELPVMSGAHQSLPKQQAEEGKEQPVRPSGTNSQEADDEK